MNELLKTAYAAVIAQCDSAAAVDAFEATLSEDAKAALADDLAGARAAFADTSELTLAEIVDAVRDRPELAAELMKLLNPPTDAAETVEAPEADTVATTDAADTPNVDAVVDPAAVIDGNVETVETEATSMLDAVRAALKNQGIDADGMSSDELEAALTRIPTLSQRAPKYTQKDGVALLSDTFLI